MHIFIMQLFDLSHHQDHIIDWKHIFNRSYPFHQQLTQQDMILLKENTPQTVNIHIHHSLILFSIRIHIIFACLLYFFLFFFQAKIKISKYKCEQFKEMKQVKEEEKKTRHKKIHFTLVNTRRLVFFRSEKKTRLSLVKIRRILFEKINNLQIKSRNLFPNKKKKSSESIGKKKKRK